MKLLFGIRELSTLSVLVVLVLGNTALAQMDDVANQPTKSSIVRSVGAKIDAFDFVLQAAQRATHPENIPGSGQIGKASRFTVVQKTPDALQYNKKFTTTPEQAKMLYNTLVQKYGTPKSVRGKDHIWYINSPNSTRHVQSDIMTIILSMEKNGHVELLMDRDRGEDGRATWALPRRKTDNNLSAKTVGKPPMKSKARPLLVNPD